MNQYIKTLIEKYLKYSYMRYDCCSLCQDNIGNKKHILCLQELKLAPNGGCIQIRRTVIGHLLYHLSKTITYCIPLNSDYKTILCATCRCNRNPFPFVYCAHSYPYAYYDISWSNYSEYGREYCSQDGLSDDNFEDTYSYHRTECPWYKPTLITKLRNKLHQRGTL